VAVDFPESPSQPPSSGPYPIGDDGMQPHVLVVDDEDGVRRVFSRVLVRAGFRVTEAADGVAALSLLSTNHYDVLLSDINMPTLSGVGLLAAVRKRSLTTQVVLATGNPTIETAMGAVELGAVRYLAKPVDHRVLVEVIREAARRQKELERVGDNSRLMAAFEEAIEYALLYIQPVVSLRRRMIWGYEALLRTTASRLSSPMSILAAAGPLQQLDRLGRHVRQLAAEKLKQLPPDVQLLVNLHPQDLFDSQLQDPQMPLSVVANRIILEVTEHASIGHRRDVERTAQQLRNMGFGIAIDDLGAGHAGLNRLLYLRPSLVKLDMELVRGIQHDSMQRTLVSTMIRLCEDLGIQIIVEGVETKEERDVLADLGCDLMQGYFFARPQEGLQEILPERYER
jgi:EAL domain-containing protein (putative c-di-GMP-specific phosphodiesterase class I)/CheY-like chemotaxis protein